ncbi:MAG: hypothetical protein M5U15_09265 [Kiritimatiellae bacterium]|nr:hypothetical protein [Kiritimatiellia bacterium]
MGQFLGMSLTALLLVGCATPRPQSDYPGILRIGGEIVRVNSRAGYVVAECSVLPSPGEEATVVRGDQPVGRIRFGEQMRPPYAVADLIEGRALAGDRWRIDRGKTEPPLEQKL